jgi:hypothetical protein
MKRRWIVASASVALVVGLGWPVSAFANAGGGQSSHGDKHHGDKHHGDKHHGDEGDEGHNGGGDYGPHGPETSESSSSTHPGGCVSVDGRNYSPNESITLTLGNQPVPLGWTHTDGSGSFSKNVCIPSKTISGDYTIVPSGAAGDSSTTGISVAG